MRLSALAPYSQVILRTLGCFMAGSDWRSCCAEAVAAPGDGEDLQRIERSRSE